MQSIPFYLADMVKLAEYFKEQSKYAVKNNATKLLQQCCLKQARPATNALLHCIVL